MVGATASGVPYYYPPMGQPAGPGPGGMMIGRPAVDPTGVYVQPPSQAWQSVWQTAAAEDGSYGSGGSSGQGNLDGQGKKMKNILLDEVIEIAEVVQRKSMGLYLND
ncbi:hypothetical protein GH714_024455 [Hevea brasiliensis]|uniref:Uncharacterized protein n=1 Tax=Hevea brasiliensis TaxID=3981 RepID=A0A6A6MF27_HEVBR|nr:hypothetical protein GH714_024455 [Hevea brasiliensis]